MTTIPFDTEYVPLGSCRAHEMEGTTMTTFISRPSTIDAIPWDGENFWDPVKWGEGKVRFVPRPGDDDEIQEPMRLLAGKDGAQEWVPVPIGHWLVCQPGDKSDIWPVDAEYFAAKYRPATSEAEGPHEHTWCCTGCDAGPRADLECPGTAGMSGNGVSAARHRAAQTHAGRSWDCGCGRRCWGNGGKASHERACVVAMQDRVDMYISLEESGRQRGSSAHWSSDAAHWQERLNARVEKETST